MARTAGVAPTGGRVREWRWVVTFESESGPPETVRGVETSRNVVTVVKRAMRTAVQGKAHRRRPYASAVVVLERAES